MRSVLAGIPGLLLLVRVVACQADETTSTPAPGASAQAPFMLEFKFRPGTEFAYDFSSVITQRMSVSGAEDLTHKMTLTGVTRQIAADVENDGRVGLIGIRGHAAWMLTSGSGGTNMISRDETWCGAHRVDATGLSIRRQSQAGDRRQHLLRRAVDQFSEITQICAPFPTNRVGVGSQWQGGVLLPTPGTRQPGRAVSTITQAGTTNGTRFCVIRSEVTSGGEQSHETWKVESWGPDMEIHGTTEGRFDLDRGIWLETKVNLQAKFAGRVEESGFDGVMSIRGMTKLRSAVPLPAQTAAEQQQRTRALDGALKRLFANDFEEGVKMLEHQHAKETDPDWKQGLNVALAMTRPLLKYDSNGVRIKRDSEQEAAKPAEGSPLLVYAQAAEYTKAGELDKALEAYSLFLAAKDDDIPAGTRLLAQFRVANLLEKLGRIEEALDAYRKAGTMNADDDYSRKLKEKAAGRTTELMNKDKK